jgi:two-component system nitrogen regulation response regulator NtrX
MPQQAKLLRFLDSHEYRPLGGNALRQFSGRVVAATNRTLADEVRHGRFREDLMFRLSVATVRLPPLREHMSDLELLTQNLLAQLCEKYDRKQPTVRQTDIIALREYHFPGNVRELRNLLERALLRTPETAAVLAFDSAWLSGAAPAGTVATGRARPSLPPDRQLNALETQEYCLIQEALRSEDGGIRRAAARLGITHQALMRRLEKWPELRHTNARSN